MDDSWKLYFESEAPKNQIGYSDIYISIFYLFISKQFVIYLKSLRFHEKENLLNLLKIIYKFLYIYFMLLKNCYSISNIMIF